jgi:hypothetical protein
LPTLVKVKASMKAVNITLQHAPESQKNTPAWRIFKNTSRPRNNGSATARLAAVKKARQKVTSKLRADSKWRVITPAVDHSRVTATIKKTARVWVSFKVG